MVEDWFRPARWKRPTQAQMFSYPKGRPPFDPFPEATLICQSDCPIKIYNIMIKGGNPTTREFGPPWVGQSYHNAIVELKANILANPSLVAGGPISIIERLGDVAKRVVQQVTGSSRGTPEFEKTVSLLQKYIKRKVQSGELQTVPDEEFFSEVSISNPYTQFEFEGSTHTYPLRCRIDELNVSQGRLVERFSGGQIPSWKPVQAWLNARALLSLEGKYSDLIPARLSPLFKREFEIVVETPYEDVVITDEFSERVLQGYAWCQEIFRPSGNLLRLFKISKCQPPSFDEECPFLHTHCFTTNYPFPSTQVKRKVRPYARRLLYDLVWDQDLYTYQASMLPPDVQLEHEISWSISVEELDENRVLARITTPPTKLREGEDVVITSDSYVCGERVPAEVTSVREEYIELSIRHSTRTPLAFKNRVARVYRQELQTLGMYRPPKLERITKNLQSTLHRVTLLGASSERRFQESSALLTMDALFGGTPIIKMDDDAHEARLYELLDHFVSLEEQGVEIPESLVELVRRRQ